MTHKIKSFTFFLVTLCTLSCSGLKAQIPANTGFVDVNKVLQSMPGYADSVKLLNNIRTMYQNQYNYLLIDLQQKIKQYQIQKDSLSPFVANIRLQEINTSQRNLDTFQSVANTALSIQQDKILSGFLNEIRDASGAIGSQKKYIAIWDAAMLKNAIWTDPKADMTSEVVAYLANKNNPGTAPKSGKSK